MDAYTYGYLATGAHPVDLRDKAHCIQYYVRKWLGEQIGRASCRERVLVTV